MARKSKALRSDGQEVTPQPLPFLHELELEKQDREDTSADASTNEGASLSEEIGYEEVALAAQTVGPIKDASDEGLASTDEGADWSEAIVCNEPATPEAATEEVEFEARVIVVTAPDEPRPNLTPRQASDLNYLFVDEKARSEIAEHTNAIHVRLVALHDDVLDLGRRLRLVKRLLQRGQFGQWLEREFTWSQDTAENFMNVAKLVDIDPKFSEYFRLFPRSALYLLARNSTPDSAREEALAHVAAGGRFSAQEVRELVKNKSTNRQHHERSGDADLETDDQPRPLTHNESSAGPYADADLEDEQDEVSAEKFESLTYGNDSDDEYDQGYKEHDGQEPDEDSAPHCPHTFSEPVVRAALNNLLLHGADVSSDGLFALMLAFAEPDDDLAQVASLEAAEGIDLLIDWVIYKLYTTPPPIRSALAARYKSQ
jgi:hypothetical protein